MIDVLIIIIGLSIAIIKIRSKPKQQDEVYEIPNEEKNINIRAYALKAEQENQRIVDYKKAIDVRQFSKRTDVTREEVQDYIIAHKRYEGWNNICYIVEAIKDVSNINEDDIKEIKHYLWKKVPFNESKEDAIESEYHKNKFRENEIKWIQQDKEFDKRFKGKYVEKVWNKMEHPSILSNEDKERIKMTYHYEDWLKEKGYI